MAILFDLDGTLVDTAPDFALAIARMRAQQNSPPAEAPSLNDIRLAVPNGIKALTQTGFAPNSSPALEQQLLGCYKEALGLKAILFEGIDTLLCELENRKIPWGIVTNKEARFTRPLLEKLQLWDRAACVVSGDTTQHAKPHPEPLLYACEEIECDPKHCVYIGDAERDIIAGQQAGMATIAALFGYIKDINEAKTWKANYYAKHPNDILPWITAWQAQQ
jgi:phosphoglycolate phosphatase